MPGADWSWENDALCAGLNPDPWFEVENARALRVPASARLVLFARGVCTRCPVREACLEASEGAAGIWGGLTAVERRKLFRERRRLG